MITRWLPALAGLAVAAGLYAWRGGHYPLPVDLLALGAVGLMVAVGVRQLLERPHLTARRAARTAAEERRRREAAVREAADVAITEARREAGAGTPGRVEVADVLAVLARPMFNAVPDDVPPSWIAAVLRARFELRAGGLDLTTDAWDVRYDPMAWQMLRPPRDLNGRQEGER